MNIVSVAEMRRLERDAMSSGVSGQELMGLAGEGAGAEILELARGLHGRHRRRYVVLAGKGNNGGDGWVVARYLHEAGEQVVLHSVCPPWSLGADACFHARRLPAGCPWDVCSEGLGANMFRPGDVIVDALLGTGVTGEARGVYKSFIDAVNASGLPVVSLDVPSGLDADTGEGGSVVRADWTITMGLPKAGVFQGKGAACCGTLRVVEIGLPVAVESTAHGYEVCGSVVEAFGRRDARVLLGRRAADGHKNRFGHVVCLCGSSRYMGAGELCAAGALRSGAGLVTLAVPGGCALGMGLSAVIRRRLGDLESSHFDSGMLAGIEELTSNVASSVVYGPGTGRDVSEEVLRSVIASGKPLVIDADGLRQLSACRSVLGESGCGSAGNDIVLTPHPGEMRALQSAYGVSGDASGAFVERVGVAHSVSLACGCVVVLKGRFTVVASPNGSVSVNTSGDSSLGTAGSGDVLAGVIGGYLGQGLDGYSAARLGVYVHGLAGELRCGSSRGLVADDLPELVSKAMWEVSPF